MKHRATPDFWYHYRELPVEIQELADRCYEKLKQDSYYPSLHFKKAGGFCIMLQYIEKFSRSTLNRMIGRKFLLLYGEYAEFFSLSTQICLNRRKVSAQ